MSALEAVVRCERSHELARLRREVRELRETLLRQALMAAQWQEDFKRRWVRDYWRALWTELLEEGHATILLPALPPETEARFEIVDG
jgi:hypothetical protein